MHLSLEVQFRKGAASRFTFILDLFPLLCTDLPPHLLGRCLYPGAGGRGAPRRRRGGQQRHLHPAQWRLHARQPPRVSDNRDGVLAGRGLPRVAVQQPELAHREPTGVPGSRVVAAGHGGPRRSQELGQQRGWREE